MEDPRAFGGPGLVGARRAEMEGEHAPFGTRDPDLGRRRLDAAPFAAPRTLRGLPGERQQIPGREAVVFVVSEARPAEPDATVGSVAQIGNARDRLLGAEVTVPHRSRV